MMGFMAGGRVEHQIHLSVALILWRKNRVGVFSEVVLGKRANDLLTFIGGGVEYGESLEEAWAREFREETGCELYQVTEWFYADRVFPRLRYVEKQIKSIGFVAEAMLDTNEEGEFLDRERKLPGGEIVSLEVWEVRELARRAATNGNELLYKPEWNRMNLAGALGLLYNRVERFGGKRSELDELGDLERRVLF